MIVNNLNQEQQEGLDELLFDLWEWMSLRRNGIPKYNEDHRNGFDEVAIKIADLVDHGIEDEDK